MSSRKSRKVVANHGGMSVAYGATSWPRNPPDVPIVSVRAKAAIHLHMLNSLMQSDGPTTRRTGGHAILVARETTCEIQAWHDSRCRTHHELRSALVANPCPIPRC